MDVFLQDIQEDTESGKVVLKRGISEDRNKSVHDPEMRQGCRNENKRFDGYKGTIAIDTEINLITATGVVEGNASNNDDAMQLRYQGGENTGCVIEAALGDNAYGSGEIRREFAEVGINVIAKGPL